MQFNRSFLILALVCTATRTAHAQEPLTPLWMHVEPVGAGSLLGSNDVLYTRISYDQWTDRIYRSIFGWENNGAYRIQVFDPEGNDETPSTPVVLSGIAAGDYQVTHVVQLSVKNDTLSAIVQGAFYDFETDNLSWLKVIGTNGSPYYLLGYGNVALIAFHRDALGTLVMTNNELRKYSATGWPAGTAAITPTQSMAVLGNDVILGSPPSISHFNRNDLTAFAPIIVPSSGTAATSYCIANGSSAFNYIAVNSNGNMDVGLMDLNNGLMWNTIISIPQQERLTAFHVDAQGDIWIAVAHITAGQADLGLLYRIRSTGGPYTLNSFSRRIDGITSNGSRIFLTGRVAGTSQSTYLAAFDVDLITQTNNLQGPRIQCYPNPATNEIQMIGLPPGIVSLNILDATGRIVRELRGPFMETMVIHIADLPNGSYMLTSSGSEMIIPRSFTVLR